MLIPPGWREIVRIARDAAAERLGDGDAGTVVEATGLDGRGRLLLRISSSLPAHVRGVAAAAHALSGEICDQCGGPGDPVRLAGTPTRTTRCGHCRGTADEVLPRPAWRRHRDVARESPDPRASYCSYRSCPVVEDVLTDEDLTALMEAREHDGWPAELAGGVYGMPYWLIRDTGWNALIRAAFTLLLPLQCDGQAQPLRLSAVRVNGIKPRCLSYEGYGFDAYRWGITALVRIYSQSTCIGCGLLRVGAAHRPGRRCRLPLDGPRAVCMSWNGDETRIVITSVATVAETTPVPPPAPTHGAAGPSPESAWPGPRATPQTHTTARTPQHPQGDLLGDPQLARGQRGRQGLRQAHHRGGGRIR